MLLISASGTDASADAAVHSAVNKLQPSPHTRDWPAQRLDAKYQQTAYFYNKSIPHELGDWAVRMHPLYSPNLLNWTEIKIQTVICSPSIAAQYSLFFVYEAPH